MQVVPHCVSMARRKKADIEAAKNEEISETVADTVTCEHASIIVEPDYGFDVLADTEDVSDSIEQVLTSISSRRKNHTVQFNRLSEVREKMLPVRHFYLQWALGLYGIPEACLIEIIGAEGLGKSTLAFQFIGWAMDKGCPAFYIECENKQLQPGRVLRALHPNKERAVKMLKRLRRSKVFSLEQLEQEITDYVDAARGHRTLKGASHVPLRVPLLIVVDPWSKLMNDAEAAGFSDYGDNQSDAKKAKYKSTGSASNMGHAKWAQAFSRRLPEFLSKNNVILLMVHHQNDKVDMSMGGGITLSADIADLYNKTKIGGRAFNQNAAIQLILSRGGMVKGSDNMAKGRMVTMRVDKNSFGPGERKIKYEIRTDQFDDTEEFLEPAINFDEDWANWMAKNKYFGTTVASKRFKCAALGIEGATYQQFAAAFNANEEIKRELGARLGIEGYVDTVGAILKEIEENHTTEDFLDDQVYNESESESVS